MNKKFMALVCLIQTINAYAEIHFEEVTTAAKINFVGETWGSSWGDVNGDGKPDLRFTKHGSQLYIYINNNSIFLNDLSHVMPGWLVGDTHGATWVDFDNDGDQDLYETAGGANQNQFSINHLYVNERDILTDKASQLGTTHYGGRDRTPLWFDYNNDSLLDIFIATKQDIDTEWPSALLKQNSQYSFVDVTTQTGINLWRRTVSVPLISDVNNDGKPELLVGGDQFPMAVYSFTNNQAIDIEGMLGLKSVDKVADAAIADFNNDLLSDLFIVRGVELWNPAPSFSDATQVTEKLIHALLVKNTGLGQAGIQVGGTGIITITTSVGTTSLRTFGFDSIFLGATGKHPDKASFTLTSSDPSMWGPPSYTPGVTRGAFIWSQPDQKRWFFIISGANLEYLPLILQSDNPLTELTAINFEPATPKAAKQNYYFVNSATGFIDTTTLSGLNTPSNCVSVVAGDFDNDMDIDIYLVCTGHVANLPNILYENLNNGVFRKVPMAGGAEGSPIGRGESVTTVDYDGDGFLDLFVLNGHCCEPFSLKGPAQLFRNLGNINHWLELDLEGVLSNRDGVGAKVIATTGGKAQLREQNQGVHRFSQNHQRLHFGLAHNTKVDQLEIHWPSGIIQTVTQAPADQILHVLEPVTPDLTGKPAYTAGVDEGVYVWRDSDSDRYHLRISGGPAGAGYQVKVVASAPLGEATPYNLMRGEELALAEANFGFRLNSTVQTLEAGVDFTLPTGARALLSVDREGVANPRQVHAGSRGLPFTPAGWILASDRLPPRPSHTDAGHYGLVVGTGSVPEVIEVGWRANQGGHEATCTVLLSEPKKALQWWSIEGGDTAVALDNGAIVQGQVYNGYLDGIKITLSKASEVAIAFTLDQLLPVHRVNTNGASLGYPNAYWLQY